MQCDVTRCIICIYNKSEYISRQGTELQKFYKRSYIVISSDLRNAIKKILDKISFHTHFNSLEVFVTCDLYIYLVIVNV